MIFCLCSCLKDIIELELRFGGFEKSAVRYGEFLLVLRCRLPFRAVTHRVLIVHITVYLVVPGTSDVLLVLLYLVKKP